MAKDTTYIVGGTVQAGGGLYIARQADQELLALCRASKFAYVLTARQMGKSSLMVRTREELDKEGIATAIVDLTEIGVEQITADQWYLGLIVAIADWLKLSINVVDWWQARTHLSLPQRMVEFFENVVLTAIQTRIVVFIDEIDSTLGLQFTDDFFAAIRLLYNLRATKADFARLSFVLIGVATPSDLIGDPRRTPFNIGQRVTLTDFTLDEARPLIDGLNLPAEQAEQVFTWIHQWTGGHPYLIQRLCSVIASQERSDWSEEAVDRLVADTFFGVKSEQNNNLQFVRDILTKRAADQVSVLRNYRDVLRETRPVYDEEQSLSKSHLKLSGVIHRADNAQLHVRNAIYATVFDRRWVNAHLPRRYGCILAGSAAGIAVFLLIIGGLAVQIAKVNLLAADTQAVQAKTQIAQIDTQVAQIAITKTAIQNNVICNVGGSVTTSGSEGAIAVCSINEGDSPEIKQKKIDDTQRAVAGGIFDDIQAMDARLVLVNAGLQPETLTATMPGLSTPFSSDYEKLIKTERVKSLQQQLNRYSLTTEYASGLDPLLNGASINSLSLRSFYDSVTEVQAATDDLIGAMLSEADAVNSEPAWKTYKAELIVFYTKSLHNRSQIAYLYGLVVLTNLKAVAANIPFKLASLSSLEPKQSLERVMKFMGAGVKLGE